MILWVALTALATVITAVVAAVYTYFTALLVTAQSAPNVIVFVKHDPDRPSILVIRIENIGRDIAHDVRFHASRPIPDRRFAMNDAITEMKDGPLVDGIPALGPGDYREITWGQYEGLRGALGEDDILLSYTYRKGWTKFVGSSRLEVRSYANTDASARPPVIVARGIQSIAGSLASIHMNVVSLTKTLRDNDKPVRTLKVCALFLTLYMSLARIIHG